MKEVEENNLNEIKVEAEKLSSEERVERARYIYKNLQTMEEKLEFLSLFYSENNMLQELGDEDAFAEGYMALEELISDFNTEYILNSDFAMQKKVLDELGRLTGQATFQVYKDRQAVLPLFSEDDKYRERKANYIAKFTSIGESERMALIDIGSRVLSNFQYNPKSVDAVKKEIGLNADTTVKDILEYMAPGNEALKKELHEAFGYTDYNRTVYDYFRQKLIKAKRPNPTEKQIQTEIMELVMRQVYDVWKQKALDQYIVEHTNSEEEAKIALDVGKKTVGEAKKSHIEDWVEGDAKEIIKEKRKFDLNKFSSKYETQINRYNTAKNIAKKKNLRVEDVKDSDFEYEAIKDATTQKINEMISEGKYQDFVKETIEASAKAKTDDTAEVLAVEEAYMDYIKKLSTPQNNGKEITEPNSTILLEIYKEFGKNIPIKTMESGEIYEKWHQKLENGEVKGAELIADDPEMVDKIAEDLMHFNGTKGAETTHAVGVYNHIRFLFIDQQATIGGEKAVEVVSDAFEKGVEECINEKNYDPEKYGKYTKMFKEVNDNFYLTGFYTKYGNVPENESPFSKVPEVISEINAIKNDEDIKKFVEKRKETAELYQNYEHDLKDIVDQAKDMLARLKKTEEGHGTSASYIALRDALENFTKLGVEYYNEQYNAVSKEISYEDIQQAFTTIGNRAHQYKVEHTGISNLHRSNWGYGKERLDISKEVEDFSFAVEEKMKKYNSFTGTTEDKIKPVKKDMKLLNNYLVKNGKEPVSVDFLKNRAFEEEQVERQNAVVINNAPAAKNPSYEEYIRLHTVTGGLKVKTREDKVNSLAKVLAAYSLSKSKEGKDKFDLDKVHKWAKDIKNIYCLDSLNNKQLDEAIKDKLGALKIGEKQRQDIYSIKNEKYAEFIAEISLLSNNLANEQKHGKKYKMFAQTVRNAAELDSKTAGMTPEKKAEAFGQAVNDIVLAVSRYVDGKESAKKNAEDMKTFNNNMDALAIVSKYTKKKGMRLNQRVSDIIDNINKKRNVQDEIDLNSFEKDYGKKRVAEEMARKNEAAPAIRNYKF